MPSIVLGTMRQDGWLTLKNAIASLRTERVAFPKDPEDPVRGELFSIERLEQVAATLAANQQTAPWRGNDRTLSKRLHENSRILGEAYHTLCKAVREGQAITPAAEWLVDNFHDVEVQVNEIREDLPPGFYRELPKLATGEFKGYPRVFGVAWAIVSHTDSRLNPATMCRFLQAYQRVQPLTIGELWAVAITLRIVLVENLRRLAEWIVQGRAARSAADDLADRLLGVGGLEAEPAVQALKHIEPKALPSAFAVQLLQRLREQDPRVTPALTWLEERLSAQGTTADEIVQFELMRQGATNLTAQNVITSLRLIGSIDWPDFFESVSLIDAELRANSGFAEMDFATRDRYRRAIEKLARGSVHTELEVARRVIATSQRAGANGATEREQDPGYYLISRGRKAFEAELRYRPTIHSACERLAKDLGIRGYIVLLLLLGGAILLLPLMFLVERGGPGVILAVLAALVLVPVMDVAVALVNRAVMNWIGPATLPALALREGVPESLRTLIVVPTFLTSKKEIEQMIARLEVHHLSSADGDLTFALVTDWTDAPAESMWGDEDLLAAAREGIARLNRRYGPAPSGDRFLLLHRRRLWNASEGKWIGWERKRGKLHELNRMLRGATDTSFLTGDSLPAVPAGVRYVITLDADTRLPRGVAKRLIGKMAHPLNRPVFDPLGARVVEGYAVLQPRVTSSLPAEHEGSRFQRTFSSLDGMDSYAFAVSDVYQDLMDEGSFSGKGIYEVDTFEASLAGRIPENTLLSHDLLEGTFARAALATDIEVVEEFPSRYNVDAARHHRWARGDWQLLPWLFGRGPGPTRPSRRQSMPLIGRWKMLDNLRRTMSAPMMFLALLGGWMLPAASAAAWTAFIVGIVALPALLPWFDGLMPGRPGLSIRTHIRSLVKELGLTLARIGFRLAVLTDQAWLMGDAIVRTVYRLAVTRTLLLEWVTASAATTAPHLGLYGFYRHMAGGTALALAAAIFVSLAGGLGSWSVAAPLIVGWLLAPAIASWASRPYSIVARKPLSPDDARALRLVARRTWRFFETFVTAQDNMLPPDNFQEDPRPIVAHRTSPTNMGLYLLSVVAARDFGWVGAVDIAQSLEATLGTMSELERFRGHFYNWYDTRDLRPLNPPYISTVDSGNLAGHLLALANACREVVDRPAFGASYRTGLEDAVGLVRQSLAVLGDDQRAQFLTGTHLDEAIETFDLILQRGAATPAAIASQLLDLEKEAVIVVDIARTLSAERNDGDRQEVLATALALRASVQSHQRDVECIMPWALLLGNDADQFPTDSADGALAVAGMLRGFHDEVPTLANLPDACDAAIHLLEIDRSGVIATMVAKTSWNPRMDALLEALARSSRNARTLERRLIGIAQLATELAEAMAFGFLLDPERQLLSIGFAVYENRLDPSCYDLLASEARLASFFAIAKGDIPTRHWFRLGRAVTPVDGGSVLISWSGSMFEYLMPSLVLDAPAGSQLEQTMRLVVRRQMHYGAEHGVPWGISESAYNARDLEFTYQYLNFGIPDLSLKRGQGLHTVVAPYATGLATMFDPTAALQNYVRLAEAGGRGPYGWYEALDYTPSRLPKDQAVAVVKAYMAHHQGMTVVAIANALLDGVMRKRFHAEPSVQATELLLQECPPRDVAFAPSRLEEGKTAADVRDIIAPTSRQFHSPHDVIPRTHLLSNGNYSVMITGAGSGYARCRDLDVTRWREDVTCDAWGSYLFLRDAQSGDVWSAGYQPTCVEPDVYEVSFSEDRAEIFRRDGSITTKLEVVISTVDCAEVRRLSITNFGSRSREIEVTSYAELVLAPQGADVAHPAYSKMFVQTEFVAGSDTLLATRRRRSPGEVEVWAAHLAVIEGEAVGQIQYETDRARFIGRGRALGNAVSVVDGRPLSSTVGTVLDPIFALRYRIRLGPGETARLAFWTLLAPSRDEALDLADKHRDRAAFERTLTMAWTQAQVQLHHLGANHDEAHLFQRLANYVLYANPNLRPPSDVLARNEQGQSALWAHGISGDLPIVLCRIDETEDLGIVRQLLQAHAYWRLKHLAVDLIIINEKPPSYEQNLQSSLEGLVRASLSQASVAGESARGNVAILRGDLISFEVRGLLLSVARAVLLSRRGSLSDQIKNIRGAKPPTFAREKKRSAVQAPSRPAIARPELEFFNGLGGFAADGKEYLTVLGPGQWTPTPWINVIANPSFGFQVSVEGGGYTWAVNSKENQLSPWSNDPVGDRPGEVLYIRDEDDGAVWGPTALPTRDEGATYVTHHGQGFTRFEQTSHEISLELLQFVPLADPIKISRLKIRNLSGRTRHLSVTAYVEWVLGASRAASAPTVSTSIDPATGALFARNPWSTEFGHQVAFMDLGGHQQSWTGDRAEFIGRNGSLKLPAALAVTRPLSRRVGAGFDPCGVLQSTIELKPGAVVEIACFLGEAAGTAAASHLVARYRKTDLDAVLAEVKTHWADILDVVQVKTPDRALDVMMNGWLLYQTLACRVWARAAFYQASGAYGFRDQLQDLMALAVAKPEMLREHLLRAAARQFVEGDVQHWWLPQAGNGVRTRMTDDRLWLPYVTAYYIGVTGDLAVLDEVVPYLEGRLLAEGEGEAFFVPGISRATDTLYEHCARALDVSLAVGVHGLPLMGTGDWNDGMNRVGEGGKGESTWLGWFLHTTLEGMATFADARAEVSRATGWRGHAATLCAAIERDAWDGEWYRRGYFDDGTPLGSAASSECQIDSIAQSWGVMSGAADPARSMQAMASLEDRLVRRDDRLLLLFAPPFDETPLDPGYIKGYPPGLRENGGQYTHAAAWSVIAFAQLGDGTKAMELLSILNPINHTRTRAGVQRYKVEPYVVAADVYSQPPHVGRGGWTWYTGSAGWLYRAGLEWILGFHLQGETLILAPCIPKQWPFFELKYRHRTACYDIRVDNPDGVCRGIVRVELDGEVLSGTEARFTLVDDGERHQVRITLG